MLCAVFSLSISLSLSPNHTRLLKFDGFIFNSLRSFVVYSTHKDSHEIFEGKGESATSFSDHIKGIALNRLVTHTSKWMGGNTHTHTQKNT
jgi:hypothetical protein